MTKSILETILEPGALSVVFQPIFDIRDGIRRVDSVEALVRGPRGTHFTRADILFDYVRRKKAEASVDQRCLITICDAMTCLPEDVRVNVNVHASTLGQSPAFVDYFRRYTKKCSLQPHRFTIEIVEHAPTCNASQLTNSIAQLREYGSRIALDDVGLGQSNYRMMLDCHPDYFKLDAYFVRDLSRDTKRRAVVESLVTLARALNSAVVAEAVSNQEDLFYLAKLGVHLVQANMLCAAQTIEELQKMGHLVGASPDPGDRTAHASARLNPLEGCGRDLELAISPCRV